MSQLAGFLFAMGVAQSLSYFIARDRRTGPRLLTTWMLMLIPLTVVAIVISELLLPTIFPNNPHDAGGDRSLVPPDHRAGRGARAELRADTRDARLFRVQRAAPAPQPALMAAAFVVLWPLDALTVTTALLAPAAATALVLVVGMWRSIGQIGLQAPDFRLGLHTLWFGVRGQGYRGEPRHRPSGRSRAARVRRGRERGALLGGHERSLIIYQLANTFSTASVAARRGGRRPRRHPKGDRLVLGGDGGGDRVAVGLAILAEPLLGLVYGDAFRGADESLRWLLPGAVLFRRTSIIGAGVYAAGRPFAATLPQMLDAEWS